MPAGDTLCSVMPKRPELPELGRIGSLRPKAQRAARFRWARLKAGYRFVTTFVKAVGLENQLSSVRSHDNGSRSFTLERARKYAELLGFQGD